MVEYFAYEEVMSFCYITNGLQKMFVFFFKNWEVFFFFHSCSLLNRWLKEFTWQIYLTFPHAGGEGGNLRPLTEIQSPYPIVYHFDRIGSPFLISYLTVLWINCQKEVFPYFSAQQVRDLFKLVKHLVNVGRSAKDRSKMWTFAPRRLS